MNIFLLKLYFISGSKNNGSDGSILHADETNCTKEESDNTIQLSESKMLQTVVEKELANEIAANDSEESVEIKVIFNKKKYDVKVSSNLTILDLKKQLQNLLGMCDKFNLNMYT